VTDILHRVELHAPEQARTVLTRNMLPWIGEQMAQGRVLVLEARLLDDDITDKQRGYLHGVVLTEIAKFAYLPDGQRYDMKVWKEHFRKEWLGFKTVTTINPITGKKSRHRVRISTEDLGVRKLAEYIDRIIAFAATDLGLTISEPLPPELRGTRARARAIERGNVDAETGEITEVPA
jgi:hypothetical protein